MSSRSRDGLTIKTLFEEARQLLAEAGLPGARVEPPKSPQFGEATTTTPFAVARERGEDPLKIASEVAARIRPRGLIARAEATPPGYINFHADWRRLAEYTVGEVSRLGASYGFPDLGGGAQVLIEHTSVNPNKALHIGHARNLCIGDLLARLFSRTGHRVVVTNYIDDSGAQMAEILLGFLHLGYPLEPPEGTRFDEYCGDVVYVEVNRRGEEDPSIDGLRREIARLIEERGSREAELARQIADRVLREQMKTCMRLGARYDVLCRESDVLAFSLWSRIFERLKERGAVYEARSEPREGCWCIDLKGHPVLSKEGDEVLVKSDGGTTYVARDIAYAAWKLGEAPSDFRYRVWGRNADGSEILITGIEGERREVVGRPRLAVTVIDSRQRRPQMIVKYALERIGVDASRYVHFSYEPVTLSRRSAELVGSRAEGRFVHMSGRRGIYFKVDDVLDSLREIARRETEKRHREWSHEKVSEVAEAIAVSSMRYNLIKSDTDKAIVFDIEESSRLEGDTGPYLQYSVARASRILEKASAEGISPSLIISHDPEPAERELIRALSHVPLVVEEVVESLLIKKLTTHARALAISFNDFYEQCPVIGSDEEIAGFRLSMVDAFRRVEAGLLEVIGIPILNEM